MNRCAWVNLKNPLYIRYHDEEWGAPGKSEQELYELLILESFQAGLSWECVLNKREAFCKAYEGFDIEKVCAFDDNKINALTADASIIRNRLKIASSVTNSRILKSIISEFGSLRAYFTSFTGIKPIVEPYTLRTTSPLSDSIAADLKKRGIKFSGSTIIYSFLQAAGFISAHGPECCLHKTGDEKNP